MRSIAQYQDNFQAYLTEHTFTRKPIELYDPANYILSLGGKRLRPVLALMGCELFSENIEKALPIAMAIEVFHNFSLIHDDIMDAAPLRRGKATVHEKYGLNAGILSGDVMMIAAYDFLVRDAAHNQTARLMQIFNKMAYEVCEGQQFDMNFEHRNNVTREEYIKMIELKTAVLIATAFQMGALVGNAHEVDAHHLYEFGRNLGIAFQIQDDILDTYGDPEKFGKKLGGDICQNKKTLLVLETLERANAVQKQQLSELLTTKPLENSQEETHKIEAVKALYGAVGTQQYVEKIMNTYLEAAFNHLEWTTLSTEKKTYVRTWAENLMQREY
jgi:geranylgeranyl diphosphate synthase, type II